MKKSVTILFTFLILVGCGINITDSSVDDKFYFKKVIYFDDKYVFSQDSLFDNSYQVNLISTFVYYGIPVEIDESDFILLHSNMLDDMNMLYNITKKSEDTAWLKSHVWNTGREIIKAD